MITGTFNGNGPATLSWQIGGGGAAGFNNVDANVVELVAKLDQVLAVVVPQAVVLVVLVHGVTVLPLVLAVGVLECFTMVLSHVLALAAAVLVVVQVVVSTVVVLLMDATLAAITEVQQLTY